MPIETITSPETLERERTLKWITYYWSTGQTEHAYALGWDGEWERRAGSLVPGLVDHISGPPADEVANGTTRQPGVLPD